MDQSIGDRSTATNLHGLADSKTGALLRPSSEATSGVIQLQPMIGDSVFASPSGDTPIIGYRKIWLRIAKPGELPAATTPCAAP
jgi:hypothetical protein